MFGKFEFNFSINFDSEEQTKIVYSSLLPEFDHHRFERSKVSIGLKKKKIIIRIITKDVNAAKASVSSILQWISTTNETLNVISKQIFNS